MIHPKERSATRWRAAARLAALVTLMGTPATPARAQAADTIGTGTYELTWFTVNTLTRQPDTARMVLVLSAAPLPPELAAKMRPGVAHEPTPRPRRACWRLTAGAAPMFSAASSPITTDWQLAGPDSLTVQLWFIVDAGSSLRVRLIGDELRGEVWSFGWMGGTGNPRTRRDSVVGRRVGDADASRCLP